MISKPFGRGFFNRRRLAPLLLAVSLGANIFLAGWWISLEASGDLLCPNLPQPRPAPEMISERIAAALPKADGELLRRTVAEQRDRMDEAHAAYLDTFARLRDIVAANLLDEAAMRSALSELRVRQQTERFLLGDAITDALVRMSPEGRKAFVDTRLGGSAR